MSETWTIWVRAGECKIQKELLRHVLIYGIISVSKIVLLQTLPSAMSTRDKQHITHKACNMFTVVIDRFTESRAS